MSWLNVQATFMSFSLMAVLPVVHTGTHAHTCTHQSTIYHMAFLSPLSTFEWLLVAHWDAETLKCWISVFFYFSWQLPHLNRGNGGLPAELQQTPGPTQRAHPAAAPGTWLHIMLIKLHETWFIYLFLDILLKIGFLWLVWFTLAHIIVVPCSFCCAQTFYDTEPKCVSLRM